MASPTHLSVTPSDNGGYSIEHGDGTTHVFSDLTGAVNHVGEHYGVAPKEGTSGIKLDTGGKDTPAPKLTRM